MDNSRTYERRDQVSLAYSAHAYRDIPAACQIDNMDLETFRQAVRQPRDMYEFLGSS